MRWWRKPAPPAHRCRRRDAGFTLVEVLIALLVAMIGLMGTVAIQQTVLSATQNANDAQIAMRLATQTLEELQTRVTFVASQDRMSVIADGIPRGPDFMNEQGGISGVITARNRFSRRFMVTNRGVSLPYNIVVEVRYALDSAKPKLVRLDSERRKSW